VTPSAIGQAVRALEARVGSALFIRTTRGVGLTEVGEGFLSRAKPAFEELVAASAAARDLGLRPAGLLRLSVPRAVVPILLEPLIASFAKAYPEIKVEIAASEKLVDLAAEGFDAGIRQGEFIAHDMIVVRLTPPFPFVVVGSPEYLQRQKQPERIDDLRQHACLSLRRSDHCALDLSRRQQGGRGHRLWAAHRARLPHTPRAASKGWALRRCPVFARSSPRHFTICETPSRRPHPRRYDVGPAFHYPALPSAKTAGDCEDWGN
jgi:DNA-binding transcriptional LysR family regulator